MTAYAFSPAMTGGTVGLTQSVTLASGAPGVGTVTIQSGPVINTVLVTNTATLTAFVRLSGTNSLTATTADIPIPPASSHMVGFPNGKTIFGYATNAQTLAVGSAVYFTPCDGGGGF